MAQFAPGATLAPTRTGAVLAGAEGAAAGATGALMLVADGATALAVLGVGTGVGGGVGALGGGGVLTAGGGVGATAGGASAISRASTVWCVARTTSRAKPDNKAHSNKACKPSTQAMPMSWGWRWRCA